MSATLAPEFIAYLESEVKPAVEDLKKVEEASRKHVQKLVYTNVVDRFDSLVDGLLLENCQHEVLKTKALSGSNEPIKESDLFDLLLGEEDVRSSLESRLQAKVRASVLRKRHSRKLSLLLRLFDDVGNVDRLPRVNPSTGAIFKKRSIQVKSTPHSVCGYADYLYSRRNGVVHGAGGKDFLKNDREQVKKIYEVDLTKKFSISLGSITIAAKFYEEICKMIE